MTTDFPSSAAVAAELKRRNPERYGQMKNFNYFPGTADGATLDQVVNEIERVDREMADPRKNLAARLDGEAFLMEDSAECLEKRSGLGIERPQTLLMRAKMMRDAAEMLRQAASDT